MALYLGDDRLDRVLERHVVHSQFPVALKADPLAATLRVPLGSLEREAVGLYSMVVIVACAEGWPPAFQDDHLDGVIVFGLVERLNELGQSRKTQRVVFVRSVEDQSRDRSFFFEDHFFGHIPPP